MIVLRFCVLLVVCLAVLLPAIQGQQQTARTETVYVLKPARVFDGESAQPHEGWAVVVRGQKIEALGPLNSLNVPKDANVINLPGLTLMPGMIEAHSHVLLHPYSETVWNDQVTKESLSLRVARATNHLRNTLQAGFTTIRDLGTEGAAYADVGLKQAVEQGIIPGPRMIVTTRAIVATGSYGPKGFASEWRVPQGAEEADGVDSLTRVVRDQIGHGADWIKIYADYRWGTQGAAPTFSLDEIKLDRRNRQERKRSRRRSCNDGRRNASRNIGGCRNDRARRRRNAGSISPDERTRRRVLSDAFNCHRRKSR